MLAAAAAASACDRKPSPQPERAVVVAAVPDAQPVVVPDAAAAPTDGACEPASFAAYGACGSGGRCIQIYEVDAACVVQQRRELSFTDAAEEIVDVVWPRRDSEMYIAVTTDASSHTAWGTLASPLASNDKAVAAIKWNTEKLGAGDQRGAQFGLDTDGTQVAIAACTEWADDNEEEWHCTAEELKSITGKRDPGKAFVPPFTTAFTPGAIVPGVTLRKHKRELECRIGTGKWTKTSHPVPVSTAVLDGDNWVLVEHFKGSRGTPAPSSEIFVMKGCNEDPKLRGEVQLGPTGYWAHRPNRYTTGDATLWRIHRRGSAEPLKRADGKPAMLEGDGLTWTQP